MPVNAHLDSQRLEIKPSKHLFRRDVLVAVADVIAQAPWCCSLTECFVCNLIRTRRCGKHSGANHNYNSVVLSSGVLEYYHASLEPIMQYSYLRTDVFQGFREIGNTILFCLQLENFLVNDKISVASATVSINGAIFQSKDNWIVFRLKLSK